MLRAGEVVGTLHLVRIVYKHHRRKWQVQCECGRYWEHTELVLQARKDKNIRGCCMECPSRPQPVLPHSEPTPRYKTLKNGQRRIVGVNGSSGEPPPKPDRNQRSVRGVVRHPYNKEFGSMLAVVCKPTEIVYTNHRGVTAVRRILPEFLWWGRTQWHPEPQWLIRARDLDKDEMRDFALADARPVKPAQSLVTLNNLPLQEPQP